MRCLFFWLLGGWCLVQTSAILAADIQVSVDRNPVGLNQSFKLIFTANDDPDAEPDFSPLDESLEILNQQRSSNSSWVNGQSNRSEQWILNVLAKQRGELMIPAIAFGADRSKPLKIQVIDEPKTPQSQDEVFLQVEATPEKPYVQSQVIYTLKLFRRVQITQASLGEPEIRDALVEKLGEDSTYATQINGVDYWITERKYAIFPQQSGVLTIAPLTLTAEVVNSQRPSFNGFFSRQLTETRRVSSNAISLNVLPIPSGISGDNWLSAETLSLEDSWSNQTLEIKVGEPLTRTVRLAVKGATVGQLPELVGQNPLDGIKIYPDQPLLKEDKPSDGLSALREEKIAYIPSKAGDYLLPPIDIVWFNTASGNTERATLPAVTLHAIGAKDEASSVSNQPQSTEEASRSTESQTIPSAGDAKPDTGVYVWQALSAFLALGWLFTGIGYVRKKPPVELKPSSKSSSMDSSTSEKKLYQACLANDAQAAKRALLQWGKARFASESLTALAPCCADGLAEQILQLNRALYARQAQHWQGQALWHAFNEQSKSGSSIVVQSADPLEPLYKL